MVKKVRNYDVVGSQRAQRMIRRNHVIALVVLLIGVIIINSVLRENRSRNREELDEIMRLIDGSDINYYKVKAAKEYVNTHDKDDLLKRTHSAATAKSESLTILAAAAYSLGDNRFAEFVYKAAENYDGFGPEYSRHVISVLSQRGVTTSRMSHQ